MVRNVASAVVVSCAMIFSAPRAASSQTFDPAYRFRTLQTEHFRVHFHQDEDALAARLAAIAEDTWRTFRTTLGRAAPARTDVILVDQTDLANGWATPVPRDTIAIYAVWPSASDPLKTDDWLRLAFTHEFTHILHLDRSEGWARAARRIFGRAPIAFPNVFLPTWQIEGLAVYEESALTGEGRAHAGDFRAIVDEAARANRMLPLDRVNGGLTRWPGGTAPYAYGFGFHSYLADRFGSETLARLADQTSKAVPYFGSLAFRRVFGKSLGTLWREYEASDKSSVAADTASDRPRRLTQHRYEVLGPRFVKPACVSCPPDIYYSVRNADEFPSIYRLRVDDSGTPERVATRFLGSTLGSGRGRLYFDQQENRRNAGLYSDLYAFDPATRHVRQLTHEARLVDPDVSPDGRTMAAVRIRAGQRELALVRMASADRVADVRTLVSQPDAQFNAPRWSPDGRSIVVERQRLGEEAAIVLVDADSGVVRPITSTPATRWATPTWRRDGRAIVAAAATGDEPFNLFEIDLSSLATRRLTRTTGGATWPDVSFDGSTIVYVGYTSDGFDLFETAYPAANDQSSAGSEVPRFRGSGVRRSQNPEPRTPELRNPGTPEPAFSSPARAPHPYSPWPTLPPTSWLPTLDVSSTAISIGAWTAGADVLGYHRYSASAAVRRDRTHTANAGSAIDWHLSYAYSRWQPSFFVSSSSETSSLAGPPDDVGRPSSTNRRERSVEAGVALPINHTRTSQLAFASFFAAADRFTSGATQIDVDRGALRFGWTFRSAHTFANSISPERGVTVGLTTELVRKALGSIADATTSTADARVYLPGAGAHHVVAVRLAGGLTRGDLVAGRTFLVGGGASNVSVLSFDSEALSLLRGFGEDSFAGARCAVVNVDYRFPLARIERGYGTWPAFVHSLHAAVFADAGQVWTRQYAAGGLKTSFGGEVSARIVAGYSVPLILTAGVGRGHDGARVVADQTSVYARVGFAF